MRSNAPPTVAKWLLHHLGCSPNNDAVIGDLDERYRENRSRAWYWKQASLAIALSFLQEVRNHKLRAVAAVVTGWGAMFICYKLLTDSLYMFFLFDLRPGTPLTYYFFSQILPRNWAIYYKSIYPFLNVMMRLLVVCIEGELSGRTVSHVFRTHPKPMVIAYAVSVLLVASFVFVEVSLTDITANEAFAWPIVAAALMLIAGVLHGGNVLRSSGTAKNV